MVSDSSRETTRWAKDLGRAVLWSVIIAFGLAMGCTYALNGFVWPLYGRYPRPYHGITYLDSVAICMMTGASYAGMVIPSLVGVICALIAVPRELNRARARFCRLAAFLVGAFLFWFFLQLIMPR